MVSFSQKPPAGAKQEWMLVGESDTDAKILEFIRSGSVIGKAPITSMPHWGGIIPDWQLKALVAYLKTLR
jgi:hypothetical protein